MSDVAKLFEDYERPGEWRVERVGDNGRSETRTFSGPMRCGAHYGMRCRSTELSELAGRKMADSPEAVAWELLLIVAKAEGVNLSAASSSEWSQDQILVAYKECLAAVKGEARPTRTPFRIVE
jgi:hypothetical protein